MTDIYVDPTTENPAYDLILDDGKERIGLIAVGNADSLGRNPVESSSLKTSQGDQTYSDLQPPYATHAQSDWTGGRASKEFEKDKTKYRDGLRANTERSTGVILCGRETYSTGLRDDMRKLPGSMRMVALTGNRRQLARRFAATSSFSCTNIWIWVRRKGTPNGVLTVRLRSVSAGLPDAILKTSTLAVATATDLVSEFQIFRFSAYSIVSGTGYFIEAVGASGDTDQNHWEVGVEDAVGTTYKTPDEVGSVFTIDEFDLYCRATTVADGEPGIFFQYKQAQYFVDRPADGSGSILYLNGARGLAASNSGNMDKLICSAAHGVYTDTAIGKIVMIIEGTGVAEEKNYRVVTSNDADSFTVDEDWLIEHDSTTVWVLLGMDKWTSIVSLSYPVTDVHVSSQGIVYFCRGEEAVIRRMKEEVSGGAWTRTVASEDDYAVFMTEYYNNGYKIVRTREDGTVSETDVPTEWVSLTNWQRTVDVTAMSYELKVVTLTAVNALAVGDKITVSGVDAGFGTTNIDGDWICQAGTDSNSIVFTVDDQPTGITPQERWNVTASKITTVDVTGVSFSKKIVTLTATNTFAAGDKVVVEGVNDAFTVTNVDGEWVCQDGTDGTHIVFTVDEQPTGTNPRTARDVITIQQITTADAITNVAYTAKVVTITVSNSFNSGDSVIVFGVDAAHSLTQVDGIRTLTSGTSGSQVEFSTTIQPTGTSPSTKKGGLVGKLTGSSAAVTGISYSDKIITLTVTNSLSVGNYISVVGVNYGLGVTNVDGCWKITDRTATSVSFEVANAPDGTTPWQIQPATVTRTVSAKITAMAYATLVVTLTAANNFDVGDSLLIVGVNDQFSVTNIDGTRTTITGTNATTIKFNTALQPVGTTPQTLPEITVSKTVVSVGDKYDRVTGIQTYKDNNLYDAAVIFKESGPWMWKNGVADEMRTNEMATVSSGRNGRASAVQGVYLYFSVLNTVWRFYNPTFDDVGPTNDQGLPEDRQGAISAIVAYPGRVIIAVDGGDAGYSAIFSGSGSASWCEIYRAPLGQRIRALGFQVIPGGGPDRLWVLQGADILYIPFPSDTYDPYQDANYQFTHEFVLEFASISSSLYSAWKYWKKLQLRTDNLVEDETTGDQLTWLEVDYRTSEDDDWTTFPDNFTESDVQEQEFDLEYGVSSQILYLRIRGYSVDNTKTPRLTAAAISGVVVVDPKFSYQVQVQAKYKDKIGNKEDYEPYKKVRKLDEWCGQARPIRLYTTNPLYHNTKVFLMPLPTRPIESAVRVDEHEYQFSITLQEA